jgi:glycosyltransferase involved in cell wall biosynthesis
VSGGPESERPLDVTVLICSRDRPRLLRDTVESVLAGDRVPAEIVVVDQSRVPPADLDGLGFARGSEVRHLKTKTVGSSRARNIGLRAASHEVVVLLDDDILVEAQWLQILVGGLRVGGPRAVATGRVLPGPAEARGAVVPPAALVTRATAAVYRGRQSGDAVPGANVALYRDVVLGLGGFDERLGPGTRFGAAEDNDMGYRLLAADCEVRHVPEAVVFHRALRLPTGRARQRWQYGRGKGAFYAKHLSRSDRYMLDRMREDSRRRVRRALAEARASPRTTAAELVYLAGMLSGAAEWSLRELTVLPRRARPVPR